VIDPSPEAQDRFKEDTGANLAELSLIARGANSEDLPFSIVLGHPFRRSRFPDNFAVRVELDGLETSGTPIMGVDQFQAMILAIRFMLSRLTDITEKRGLELFWADDPRARFDPHEYFNTLPPNHR
jgi:hypothetical protein